MSPKQPRRIWQLIHRNSKAKPSLLHFARSDPIMSQFMFSTSLNYPGNKRDNKSVYLHIEVQSSLASQFLCLNSETAATNFPVYIVIWPLEFTTMVLPFSTFSDTIPIPNISSQAIVLPLSICHFCKQCSESLVHLFLLCDFMRPIWFGADLGICITATPSYSISFWLGWLHHIGHVMAMETRTFFPRISCILWCIWLGRNKAVLKAVLESISSPPIHVISHANQLSQSIIQAFASLNPARLSVMNSHSSDLGKVQIQEHLM